MTLQERLMNDLKDAMRSQDTLRKNSIRMIRAAVKNAEIELRRPLSDEEIEVVIRKEVKRRTEAIEMFTKGGRTDLVEEETAGVEILKAYLPAQMSSDELEKLIDTTLTEIGATEMRDMGRAMKAIMAKVGNRADGKTISALVRNKLC